MQYGPDYKHKVLHIQNPALSANAPAASTSVDMQATLFTLEKPDAAAAAASCSAHIEDDLAELATPDDGEVDKENCPPSPGKQHDDFAYLFETPATAKTTPKKSTPREDDAFAEFLKTPTPGSRHRLPLTPRRGANNSEAMTPSRSSFTPRSMRSATAAPETPFTRQLNAMLSDANNSSPSQIFDFSAFPPFDTPARASGAQFSDLFNDEYLSSDMPMSSSPAKAAMLGLGFDLYEDPNTSSVGMWNDSNMFSSDAVMADVDPNVKDGSDLTEVTGGTAMLKMTVGGITVDFASMIEEVVNNNDHDEDSMDETLEATETQLSPESTKLQALLEATRTQTSPRTMSQGLVQTPEAPVADEA